MDPERRELARDVMRRLDAGEEWLAAVDPDTPGQLASWMRDAIAAYEAGDLEWVLEHADPQLEIVQPAEFPGPRTYQGHAGYVENLLDWPREWEDFRVEPRRIYALDDERLVIAALHKGRSREMGVEVEAEIVWLYTVRDGLLRRWDMFLSVEAAERAAAEGG